jgi:replicative DNA helicase
MEEVLSKYKIKGIREAYEEAIDSLTRINPYLRTGIRKLDSIIRGVEANKLVTIGGISGSGKSALANIIETFIASTYKDVEVLNLSFEMSAKDQILRKLSAQEGCTTSSLRDKISTIKSKNTSAQQLFTDTKSLSRASDQVEVKALPISYVEEACSVVQIVELIEAFQKKCMEDDKWLVVFIDHALLVEGKSSEERTNVSDLQKALIKLKKRGKTVIFQLMQLNRNIEASERRTNRNMHYPTRGDLSTADAVYQASDYVMIIHRPELIGILSYGPEEVPSAGKVFLHVIKSREGDPCNLLFDNNLSINKIE